MRHRAKVALLVVAAVIAASCSSGGVDNAADQATIGGHGILDVEPTPLSSPTVIGEGERQVEISAGASVTVPAGRCCVDSHGDPGSSSLTRRIYDSGAAVD